MQPTPLLTLTSSSPDDTARIATALGAGLGAGDVVLLSGPLGAGKSHFARALIQSRLAALGRMEDVPSPSFTLVQTYDLGDVALWHADLYRLGDVSETIELGLDLAFDEAICLIEWPERLGELTPPDALHLALGMGAEPETRVLRFSSVAAGWAARLAALAPAMEA
jgi:tRNA threonylcarbamoyladenosine biosynthesis protein TsaE